MIIQRQMRDLGKLERIGVITESQDSSVGDSLWKQVSEPHDPALLVCPRGFPMASKAMHGDNASKGISNRSSQSNEKDELDDGIATGKKFFQTQGIAPGLSGDLRAADPLIDD